jgi:hypothetical protein
MYCIFKKSCYNTPIMPGPEFEPLQGQSPHLNRWDAYALGTDYPHIQPDSAVGRIAVELQQGLIDTTLASHELEQRRQTGDPLVYGDDIIAAARAADLAEARWQVFRGMYFDLQGIITHMLQGYTLYGGYDEAVDAALQRGLKGLDKTTASNGSSRQELERLNHEIALFLTLEGEAHFQGMI